ncbi:gliding motility-associated ABC transporter ATP-binding subunit GldA [Chitinophagaceae bacterium LWZ2-11]
MSIEVSGLTKIYGEQKAVNNISFKVNKGEIVGFLGPNGAGKSTTMKIVTSYLAQDAGSVKVCGIDVTNSPIETKKKIGYLPEANPLYFDMYVKEYLEFIAGVHGIKDKKTAISKVIELTGLQVEEKKKIGQLSKGYKQRVGLAAALIHDPEVLILDEPTSGLDPNQIIEIRNVIKQQGLNKTVLFSSHILQEVQAICDRVIIINKGEIVADNTLASLQAGSKKTQSVIVSFENEPAVSLLEQLPGAEKVEKTGDKTYKIRVFSPELVRNKLLELALLHNLNIVSLQTESRSLEDVFRTLTNK